MNSCFLVFRCSSRGLPVGLITVENVISTPQDISQVHVMDEITRLLVQILIALVCASVANILIPRTVPGKLLGLILIGLAGVFVGEWISNYILAAYSLDIPALQWKFKDVPILPSIVGSMIVLYVITAFMSWGRYGNR